MFPRYTAIPGTLETGTGGGGGAATVPASPAGRPGSGSRRGSISARASPAARDAGDGPRVAVRSAENGGPRTPKSVSNRYPQ
jgi:hypothetical protein